MKSIYTQGMLASLILAVAMPAIATTHDDKSILVEPAQRPLNLQDAAIKAIPQAIVRQVNEPVRIRLGSLLADEQAMARPKAAAPGVPTQVGLHRAVTALASVSAMANKLQWQTQSDGRRLAAISVQSPSAQGLRLALQVQSLPAEAKLRFYSSRLNQTIEVAGSTVQEVIARNQASGDHSDFARTYWSPVFESNEAVLEIELPAGINPDQVQISIPRVSHLYATAPAFTEAIAARGDADTCNLDATCSKTTWGKQSSSVARMLYDKDNGTYTCTGTLMNDRGTTYTPYFLTANHCISSQAVASTLWTYWFYRSASCDSTQRDADYTVLQNGALLLHATEATDMTLLQLFDKAPAKATYAGWSSYTAEQFKAATGIHHPKSDWQKISFGTLKNFASCYSTVDDKFSCQTSNSTNGNFMNVVWTRGTTEGGSSGSGVWMEREGVPYLVGTLYGGSSSCTNPSGSNFYGRFDITYKDSLYKWLDGTKPASVLSVEKVGQGLVSSSGIGIQCGSACVGRFPNTSSVTLTAVPAVGYSFTGWTGACTGTGSCTVNMSRSQYVTATFTVKTAVATAKSDCLFDWAERTYPELFSPAGMKSQNDYGYYFRYYPGTRNYLGTANVDGQITFLGTDGVISPLGHANNYLAAASCQ